MDLSLEELQDICTLRGFSVAGKTKKELETLCFPGPKKTKVSPYPTKGSRTEWTNLDIRSEPETGEDLHPLWTRIVDKDDDTPWPRPLKPFDEERSRKKSTVVRKRKKRDAPKAPGIPKGWQEGIYVPLVPPIGLTEDEGIEWQTKTQRALIRWTQDPTVWPPKGMNADAIRDLGERDKFILDLQKQIEKCEVKGENELENLQRKITKRVARLDANKQKLLDLQERDASSKQINKALDTVQESKEKLDDAIDEANPELRECIDKCTDEHQAKKKQPPRKKLPSKKTGLQKLPTDELESLYELERLSEPDVKTQRLEADAEERDLEERLAKLERREDISDQSLKDKLAKVREGKAFTRKHTRPKTGKKSKSMPKAKRRRHITPAYTLDN